ncbi:TPA: hypothetical protein L5597_002184 [Pseudomonas aeruginosa]|uniref:hypothetical protein n=1 Tax=Pseudomonas TaxID=286 RepID=UPI0009A1929C|nr:MULTISPECIES: hypothetical protein [Pseudomonas]ELV5905989.1 hypothetical protein [Pseudomonas aeruginosa]MBG4391613.1 hypothetical protein [Pseudomonas aeruginosa]MBG5367183.1 hypothetical protein [Pseudomonas aeruginosa]MBG5445156.1 hypothetical protein [Pseudomonas aeruginosa]MBG5642722.1 hypothetical protein [Pseudomonas aeruginosa]
MRYAFVLSIALLAGCGQPCSEDLAADPVRLKVLRAQCAADWQGVGEGVCRAAAEAYRRRFFSGQSGPEEYVTEEDLPLVPPTFDSPLDGEAGLETPVAFISETRP